MHRRYPHQVEPDDLISVGTVGLIQAVDRFRPERGWKLKTLDEHRIHGAILHYLRSLDPLPRAIRRFVRQHDEAHVRLEHTLGRPPVLAELAEALGLSIERYRRLESAVRAAQVVSLDAIECQGHVHC
jgi:RNA polymerase sigma factor for flagellar operon FliA